MGEYAIEQMKRDFKHLTGVEADDADFAIPPKRTPKNKCTLCGKRLQNALGVRQHMQDRHGRS